MAGIADTSKDGLISFAEFQAFEGLLCTPDALYKTAFQLFDTKGNGTVSYSKSFKNWLKEFFLRNFIFSDDFANVIQKTELHSKIPFQLDGQFIQRYFGKVNSKLNFVCRKKKIEKFYFRLNNVTSIIPNLVNCCTIFMKNMQWKHLKVKIHLEVVTYHR